MSRKINPSQLKKLHTLLSKLDLMEDKRILIQQYSASDQTSSKELLYHEAQRLIESLQEQIPNAEHEAKERMTRKLLYYGHMLKWDEPTYQERAAGMTKGKKNYLSVDGYCQSDRCSVKKPIHKMSTKELSIAVTQIEQLYKNTVKSI
ncbi:MAG: hypothetical protein AAFY41_00765 [Bacteroidota bacterium]